MRAHLRHLLTLEEISTGELEDILRRTAKLKRLQRKGRVVKTLEGRTLAMIFEKNSTRTRVSFEAGMFQMGGHALFLSSRDLQLGRGESIADSARVLSRYVDAIMIRTYSHAIVEELALHATVPVINGLSDDYHPCQVLADLFTYREKRGSLKGKRVAWVGDGNNMAYSWAMAAARVGFRLVMACPAGYEPQPHFLEKAQCLAGAPASTRIEVLRDPRDAVRGADLVVTDTWTSMGQEKERAVRLQAFAGYCVDESLMALAAPDALFMHCLPAHRGEEASDAVLDGPQSVVWDEAENRLHVQKAILEWLILGNAKGK
ncbi:MAG: ornithine carbamoyltransferase [Magnetococcales bacterium]|nr:ornithine carbamoyltransferase [Magnetococcales bacterium]